MTERFTLPGFDGLPIGVGDRGALHPTTLEYRDGLRHGRVRIMWESGHCVIDLQDGQGTTGLMTADLQYMSEDGFTSVVKT